MNHASQEKVVAPRSKKQVGFLFILSVLLIYPLPQVAIDIYLPSWPAMVTQLHASQSALQLSLSLYLFFLGAAQLIYGPLSDRFGRKSILLIGVGLFFLSSIGCMFARDIHLLLVFRVFQGLGLGCGFTVASAILADTFHGKRLAKMTSYSAMVYSFSLMFAPLLGGLIQHYIGWHANFAVMAGYAIILVGLIYFFVHETKDEDTIVRLALSGIIRNYVVLFKSLRFIGFVLCLILAYGAMVAFNVLGPFLFQGDLHVSPVGYGELLLLSGIAYFLGATTNSRLIKYFDTHTLTLAALLLTVLSGLGLLLLGVAHMVSVFSVMIFVCITLFGLGFIYPNCFALALDVFVEKGYASAMIGSAILIGVSIISALLSHLNMVHESRLATAFLVLAVLSVASYCLAASVSKRP